jgi:hypothetical protein
MRSRRPRNLAAQVPAVFRHGREASKQRPHRFNHRSAAFLIDTPKRLETSVNQTKQTFEAISNRNKIGPLRRAAIP